MNDSRVDRWVVRIALGFGAIAALIGMILLLELMVTGVGETEDTTPQCVIVREENK